jgi:hypothetical protein
MRTALFTALAFMAMISTTPIRAEILHFSAKLNGASETPPNSSTATGVADLTLDEDSKTLAWTVTYSGLTGPATMGHLHGPAAMGVAAGVQIPLTGDVSSPIKGSAALTDVQIGDLRGGLWYVNIHTAKYPKGEIRGQITLVR